MLKRIDEKYAVVKELGSGAMGAVYEARNEHTNKRVAIKVIKEEAKLEPGVVERFQREAKAAGSIDSDNITDVLDAGVDRESGAPYLVMELLDGEDLSDALDRLGPFRPELALRIVAQMLMGLERAHEAGVVHRDIKPANIFLARKGNAVVVKVSDFGVAKIKPNALGESENNALTQSSSLLGSPVYMSPEQAKGSKAIDARSDLWSTGIVLYQLLAGETPHAHADTLGLLLLSICSEKVQSIRNKAPWVPAKIDAIIMRALEMDANARFQSAGQMLEAILAALPDRKTDLEASMFVAMTDVERAPLSDPAAFAETVTSEPAPRTQADVAVAPSVEPQPTTARDPQPAVAKTAPAAALATKPSLERPAEAKLLDSSLNASLSASVARPPLSSKIPIWAYAAVAVVTLGSIGIVAARVTGSDQPSVPGSALVSVPSPVDSTPPPLAAPTSSMIVMEPAIASASASAVASIAAKPIAATVKPVRPSTPPIGASVTSAATAVKPVPQSPPSATAAASDGGLLRKWP